MERAVPGEREEQAWASGEARLARDVDDARMAQAGKQGRLGPHALVVLGTDRDLEREMAAVALALDLEHARRGAVAENLDHLEIAEAVALAGLERIRLGYGHGHGLGGGGVLEEDLEPLADVVGTLDQRHVGGEGDRLGHARRDSVSGMAGIQATVLA